MYFIFFYKIIEALLHIPLNHDNIVNNFFIFNFLVNSCKNNKNIATIFFNHLINSFLLTIRSQSIKQTRV